MHERQWLEFCLGIATAFMGLALALHLHRAQLVGKSVSKLVYIYSCIISGKHVLSTLALCLSMNPLSTKNLPAKEVPSQKSAYPKRHHSKSMFSESNI